MGSETEKLRLQLEIEKLKCESKRHEDDKWERERQREASEARERDAREKAAAHQRMLELTAQQQAANASYMAQASMAHSAITANNAMSNSQRYPSGGQTTTYVTSVTTEQYCGPISWLIGIFIFPCIFICPVDTRQVAGAAYAVPVAAAPATPVYYPPPQSYMAPATPTYAPTTPPYPSAGYPPPPSFNPSAPAYPPTL